MPTRPRKLDTLDKVLDGLRASTVKEREEASKEFRDFLNRNRNASGTTVLSDQTNHAIYEKLFGSVLNAKSAWLKAKTSTTRTLTESRLSASANALRITIEVAGNSAKKKTVKALLAHIIDTLPSNSGHGFCPPLALDYIKSLRILLSYQPHIEHLDDKDWNSASQLCLDLVRSSLPDKHHDNGQPSYLANPSAQESVHLSTHRSFVSVLREPHSSQIERHLEQQVVQESLATLSMLTSASNAPLRKQHAIMLDDLVDYLGKKSATNASAQYALIAVNNILSWSRIENTLLTSKIVVPLIRATRSLWQVKQTSLLNQLLISFLYLEPYLGTAFDQNSRHLRTDLRGIVDAIRTDYGQRVEKDQLQTDDLVFDRFANMKEQQGQIGTAIFSLQDTGSRAEQGWTISHILATLCLTLDDDPDDSLAATRKDLVDDDVRPSKRRKAETIWAEILTPLSEKRESDKTRNHLCALQVLTFAAQKRQLPKGLLSYMLDTLYESASEEHPGIASWSLLGLASCASQLISSDSQFHARWVDVWQLAIRAISNPSSCRSAAYLLQMLIDISLVPKALMTTFTRNLTVSMGLYGPGTFADSVAGLLETVLRQCQEVNPGAVSSLAENILTWLFRNLTPSRFSDRAYFTSTKTYQVGHATRLIQFCLNHTVKAGNTLWIPRWTDIGQAWLRCKEDAPTLSYLLLLSEENKHLHEYFKGSRPAEPRTNILQPRLACETACLAHLQNEINRTAVAWADSVQNHSNIIKSEALHCLVQYCCISLGIVFDTTFQDTRRQITLQCQTEDLLTTILKFATFGDRSQDFFNAVLATLREGCLLPDQNNSKTIEIPESLLRLCSVVKEVLSEKLAIQETAPRADTVDMDLDDNFESQSSGQSRLEELYHGPSDLISVASSAFALRSNIGLYVEFITCISKGEGVLDLAETAAAKITDYIVSLSPSAVATSRRVLSLTSQMGVTFRMSEAKRLLDYCADKILADYPYRRSEVALSTVLDVMTEVVSVWTDRSDQELYELGVDIYDWFTNIAADVLSPHTEQRVAQLLLKLYHMDPEYGRDQDNKTSSTRTSLFRLLGCNTVRVQFFLANNIHVIFSKFVLQTHSRMFDDLQANLPSSIDWTEGMAVRLLYLAKLGSVWHSLLRLCVYYIFEAAGQVNNTTRHAKFCIAKLTDSLGFSSPQRLFQVFAPQLLFTWLANNRLATLPFAAFSYSSLHHLLCHNEVEVAAQVLARENEDDMEQLLLVLGRSKTAIAEMAFGRAMSYAISWDVSASSSESKRDCEMRLRSAIGSKEKFKQMTVEQFAAILGNFFLTIQQSDVEEGWIRKKPLYAANAQIYDEIKNISSSNRSLPPSQQPSFAPKTFFEKIERLCRRTGHDSQNPWTTSSTSLAIRMLLDTNENALGSLHTSLMLRRLRLLISMAGENVLTGFPLETLLHSLQPLLGDSECADDAIGILQYLYQHGEAHLDTNLSFTNGSVLIIILRMCKHSVSQHNSTTQESQHVQTVERMRAFHAWLVQYLTRLYKRTGLSNGIGQAFVTTLASLRLPGNARTNSAESKLMLLLLDQFSTSGEFLSQTYCKEGLLLLTDNFETPVASWEDCLQDYQTSAKYSNILWNLLAQSSWSSGFSLWASGVIGRGYASTGSRPYPLELGKDSRPASTYSSGKAGVFRSRNRIVSCLADLAISRSPLESSLADYTLRKVLTSITDAEEATQFSQMLPDSLTTAVWEGTFGYRPILAIARDTKKTTVREALQLSPRLDEWEWSRRLAVSLCQYNTNLPLIHNLLAVLEQVDGLATEILPPMIHILLAYEREGENVLKHEMSAALATHVESSDASLRPRQQFFIRLVLYLREQDLPGESTKADRLRWLNVDFLQLARAAAEFEMPAAALLFLESATVDSKASRRASTRMSSSQPFEGPQISDELLLSIFKSLAEPDSFYGVKQHASIESVLDRLDYEDDGLQSLIFRSAQADSEMRITHQPPSGGFHGTVRSLTTLNLNSLTYALMSGTLGESNGSAGDMLDVASKLQQWDVAIPDGLNSPSASCFSVYKHLSRTSDLLDMKAVLHETMTKLVSDKKALHGEPSSSLCNILASLSEIRDVLDVRDEEEMLQYWQAMKHRQQWTRLSPYHTCHTFIGNRQVLFSTLAQNSNISNALHLNAKTGRLLEAESLVEVARFARGHGVLQEALSTANQLNALAEKGGPVGLSIRSVAKYETASSLSAAGQILPSVQLLREVLATTNSETESIAVGKSGVLAQLGHQLAAARLERPDEILANYLNPAIEHLEGRMDGDEAGTVYYEFATFCDQQLQNPGNIEDLDRITKLRNKKMEELTELEQLRAAKKVGKEKQDIDRLYRQTKTWISVDEAEYRRLKDNNDTFTRQSLQNYMLALQASDKHNICVLRFFALWLENSEDIEASDLVKKYLSKVPSWKFVLLLNQLMSRLDLQKSPFQESLRALAVRMCSEHPYHSLHHLYAFTRKTNKPGAALARYQAASEVRQIIHKDGSKGELLARFFKADNYYQALAVSEVSTKSKNAKVALKDVPYAEKVARSIPELKLPPATIHLDLQPDGDYSDVPRVVKFSNTMSVMGGISAPKLLTATGTDGKEYKQLFKSGNDDLRQDAIMEQVFEEVSKMLRNHKATQERNLHVRTYKVIPLSATSGIIEFVANTIPLDEFLQPAHRRYRPHDMTSSEAREKIASVKDHSVDTRVKEFRKICDRIQPVLRHFFLEKFDEPDEWFQKRTAYTRTTAAMSMLGHVLGLGDRHCSNILLDERSGEAVHIDLGIAFEAGRVLPIPEQVPFRLTRDIVDGMGITKTEGVFRRCCEFTMDALREDKESIMTLLNVLRYDPLHSWTVSPLRAKRMQEASRNQVEGSADQDESLSRRKEQEAGEADRALAIVEKKLSKTLSTSAMVNELIQQATDERNLGTLFQGWAAFF